ncbi:pantoate--beta-alanine ligase [Rhodococcus sp. D2-41]|uniref:Pantothenate synthetase n=1 Tax=Speluncibacter jeojiensis TaxID=2710754 RepID=A0A9X4RJ88_9ACTN|nr:pantoate--beta-alanine ligase [Rhodococcus sp. D2-41]MDG3009302.1 pantoate--beta-alanine ligase [Rhodococcus sp. D2-41]MDG3016911.1 pantoate--beta-alanine ligase [Corynebacteriales bacterium D3-21]
MTESPTAAGGYVRGQLTVHHDPAALTAVSRALRGVGRQVVMVPTMGALHAGHVSLVRQAKRVPGSVVVVSIFVNPLQFGAGEDLDAYPRTLDRDLELLREEGVELVFAPNAAAMYPHGPRTMIHPGLLGAELEGASRPTHFAGMLTVVAKLFGIVEPHQAFFGEKDYQQLTLIRQMVADLNLSVRVVGVPTVREQDGLALSSRNAYLDEDQRAVAAALSAALVAGAHAAADGAEAILGTARRVLESTPEIEVDYLELRGVDLGPAPERGDGRLLVAARLGGTRLIDNVGVPIGTGFTGSEMPGVPESSTESVSH